VEGQQKLDVSTIVLHNVNQFICLPDKMTLHANQQLPAVALAETP